MALGHKMTSISTKFAGGDVNIPRKILRLTVKDFDGSTSFSWGQTIGSYTPVRSVGLGDVLVET